MRSSSQCALRKAAILTPDTEAPSLCRTLFPSAVPSSWPLLSTSSVTPKTVWPCKVPASFEKFRTLSSFKAVRIESTVDECARRYFALLGADERAQCRSNFERLERTYERAGYWRLVG